MVMPDREKVINGLEKLRIDLGYGLPDRSNVVMEYLNSLTDAIALLKEKGTVKPKKIKGYNPPMYTIYEYKCEKCESPIMNKQPFCMGCGQAVKWG